MARTRTLSGLALALAAISSTALAAPAFGLAHGHNPTAETDPTALVRFGDRECSGVLVDRLWVLTTKTCAGGPGAPSVPATALLGTRARDGEGGERLAVVDVTTHPHRDLALARLAEPFFAVAPARLPDSPGAPSGAVLASGFGDDEYVAKPNARWEGQLTVAEAREDSLTLRADPAAVCPGDEGGPVLQRGVLRAVLTGSTGKGCVGQTSTVDEARAARVDDLTDWVAGWVRSSRAVPGMDGGGQFTLGWSSSCLADGLSVQTVGCLGTNPAQQRWEAIGRAPRFQLRNVATRQCLEDFNAIPTTSPCQDGRDLQLWEFPAGKQNGFELHNTATGRNLARMAVSGLLHMLEPVHHEHQWWQVRRVGKSVHDIGGAHSVRASNPALFDHWVRHAFGLARLDRLTSGSSFGDRADATFVLRPGLGDGSCHSLESRNFPGSFLRHANGRVRLDANDGGDVFKADATWCAESRNDRPEVKFRSLNFPDNYLRHINGEVWNAREGGGQWYETWQNFEADSSFRVVEPLMS
ncbi:hypothetical protein JOF53_006377 [Crossiella equi]|uniref:Peptidase S1 domain-containing protein n=1 Tax=Crossiella equi TaxID=130796 RepID=A0ABS5APB2_9PSEU|nr:AbfB domain-containing protein [Crossiella equi]MBP2477505.1 hypothetical protein [Crossiella equi]